MTATTTACRWVKNDGGRAAAGYAGDARDCVARAIAIATDDPYALCYTRLAEACKQAGLPRSARNGVPTAVIRRHLADLGWRWTPTMQVGQGCTVHLRADELPGGILIVRLSAHVAAVIDGAVHDTHDSTRGGTRCVYGYWQQEA